MPPKNKNSAVTQRHRVSRARVDAARKRVSRSHPRRHRLRRSLKAGYRNIRDIEIGLVRPPRPERFRPADSESLRTAVIDMTENRVEALEAYGALRTWDTQDVISFDRAFCGYPFDGDQGADADDDITGWDTSAAQSMNSMFNGCTTFNQPLDFNTVAVVDMRGMFSGCTAFNQRIFFNTASVRNMEGMFSGCAAFNQPLGFNTRALVGMRGMFQGCTAFNQPLHQWIHQPEFYTGNIQYMFQGCASFQSAVFTMTLNEYWASGLRETPLGQSEVMTKKLARWISNYRRANQLDDDAALVEEGRAIRDLSREAACAARMRAAPDNGYRANRDDYMYAPRVEQRANGREVRQRLR